MYKKLRVLNQLILIGSDRDRKKIGTGPKLCTLFRSRPGIKIILRVKNLSFLSGPARVEYFILTSSGLGTGLKIRPVR